MVNWGKDMAKLLDKQDWNKYTGHCWRRTSATCLADEGITEVALKRAGHWTSAKTAMQYINSSDVQRENQLALLDTAKMPKLASNNKNAESKAATTAAMAATNGNKNQAIGESTGHSNFVNAVKGLTANKSSVTVTTNIIITTGAPADIAGSIMANGGVMKFGSSEK